MREMGRRIQLKRKECGLTQAELGHRLGVSRQTISSWEAGNVGHFDRSFVAKMADIFHCNASWLMAMDNTTATLTYEAEGREPVRLTVDQTPIMGESALRAKLYQAAIEVAPNNLVVAIELLKSLANPGG